MISKAPVGQKSKKTKSPYTRSVKENTIERLKGYINKCGVRKVWKRELDGLNEKAQIARLDAILRELGMEGRPTLEKCKAIKERREFEEELRALDPQNVLPTRLRSDNQLQLQKETLPTFKMIAKEDSEESDIGESMRTRPRLDLSVLGDTEE